MKNIVIGVIVGLLIGFGCFMLYQDYNSTKVRVANIEQFLIQAQKQVQKQVQARAQQPAE